MNEHKYVALKLENQLCFPLYAAAREVIKQYRPYLDAVDLTYTQYVTMMVLWEEQKIGVKALGKKLFLDSGTLTPVLKSLESKGFVLRSRSKEDERMLEVTVTEKGMALRERAVQIPPQVAGCVKLETTEALQLYSLLYKLLGSFENN
ncbi:MAG: MarR family transcriptional regulator [Ruminococcaceae bacterium]|nr:MarR family transcriptional regulator [Oscillospiraceae bacterium]